MILMASLVGCSQSEPPTPVATATVAAPIATSTALPAPAASVSSGSAASAGSPDAGAPPQDASVNATELEALKDFTWDLADEAEGTDFEIDATGTSFYMPRGNKVFFKAKALNGTPPFTFKWDFADGTPPATGEMVKHVFDKMGTLEVMVWGTDASGAKAFMQLQILIVHPVEFAIRHQEDEKTIADLKKDYPDWQQFVSPALAATPAQ